MHAVKQFILGPTHEYLAVSRGIEPMDLSEIRIWSAGKGELLSASPAAFSWNFHPLPSGSFCLSRTSHLELLFPQETGDEVFTHGILVPSQMLKDYANNAMTLFHHLEKLGLWRAGLEVTRQLWSSESPNRPPKENFPNAEILPVLKTLSMDGGAEAVRLSTLNAFVRMTGIRRFASILDQILGNFTTILTGNSHPEMLLEALLDVLPIGCRTDFSFSTGLKFSQKRLFRIVFLGTAVHEQERVRHRFNLPTVSSTSVSQIQDQLLPSLKNRWSMFVATLFEQNLEGMWNEIALLDETLSLNELPRRARFWFKQIGLEEIYQKIREARKNDLNSEGNYKIFQARLSNPVDVQEAAASLVQSTEKGQWIENITKNCEENETPKYQESVSQVDIQRYLVTLSEAMHGNPLAQEHLRSVFHEITSSAPESVQNEASEVLLREGIRSWNEEHAGVTNQSCRQVEKMVDTLAAMLNMVEE